MKKIAFILLLVSSAVNADSLYPFVSIGIYHRDCAMTDPLICTDERFGSDTPGTIDLGIRISFDEPRWYGLGADQIDIGWHHQSYADRGWLIPGMLDFGGEESQIDSYGIKRTWEIKSFSVRW